MKPGYRFLAHWACCVTILLTANGCAWFGDETKRAEMMATPDMSKTLPAARPSRPVNAAWPKSTWWEIFETRH